MPFATDRDLLVFEPGLFKEVAWSAQKRAEAVGVSISATTLTSASSDFASAGVTAGHVALVNGAPLEIIERLSPTTLTVSRLRDSADAPPIPPGAVSGATLLIATFGPQIAVAHAQTMRALGIEPAGGAPPAPYEIGEDSVVNPRAIAALEALGALHLILAGAAALVADDSPLWAKAASYRERFARARRETPALIDLDADGVADAIRRVSAARLVRE